MNRLNLTFRSCFTLVNSVLFRCVKHSGNSAILVCTVNDCVVASCQELKSVCDCICILWRLLIFKVLCANDLLELLHILMFQDFLLLLDHPLLLFVVERLLKLKLLVELLWNHLRLIESLVLSKQLSYRVVRISLIFFLPSQFIISHWRRFSIREYWILKLTRSFRFARSLRSSMSWFVYLGGKLDLECSFLVNLRYLTHSLTIPFNKVHLLRQYDWFNCWGSDYNGCFRASNFVYVESNNVFVVLHELAWHLGEVIHILLNFKPLLPVVLNNWPYFSLIVLLPSIEVIFIWSDVCFSPSNFPKTCLVLYHFEIKSLRVVIGLNVIADISVECINLLTFSALAINPVKLIVFHTHSFFNLLHKPVAEVFDQVIFCLAVYFFLLSTLKREWMFLADLGQVFGN